MPIWAHYQAVNSGGCTASSPEISLLHHSHADDLEATMETLITVLDWSLITLGVIGVVSCIGFMGAAVVGNDW